ncbi:hypothetical protein Tco_0573217 [Tanacetum coccineum]
MVDILHGYRNDKSTSGTVWGNQRVANGMLLGKAKTDTDEEIDEQGVGSTILVTWQRFQEVPNADSGTGL